MTTASEEHTQLMSLSDIQSQRGRFRVWCGNLGALQQGPGSADYRLRESTVMHSNVTKLLQQLHSHLNESVAVVSGSRLAFERQPKPEDSSADETACESDDETDAHPPKKELEMRLSRIVAILGNLYRLGFKIRNPHIRPVSLRASLYSQVDQETNVEVFDAFSVFDKAHVDELLRQLRGDRVAPAGFEDCLQPRLIAAITRRRRQLKYWERHARKLDIQVHDSDNEADVKRDKDALDKLGVGDEIDIKEKRLALDETAKSSAHKTMLSQTEATRYDNLFDDMTESGTIVTMTTIAVDSDGNYVDLPEPPAAAKEGDFTCPYCFVLCEQKYGRKKTWRYAHTAEVRSIRTC